MKRIQSSAGEMAKPKMWLMKTDLDDGTRSFKSSSNINDIRLSCDCTCSDCKATYNAYIDEKAMTKVLQERLDENQTDTTNMIEQVQTMEEKYKAQIEDLEQSIREKLFKIDHVNSQLEIERKLRMEEMYKLEFQREEHAKQTNELRETKQLLTNAVNALPRLERENQLLKEQAKRNSETITKMDAELHQYSYELTKLEDINTRLRLRLNDSNMEMDQYRLGSLSGKQSSSNTQILRPIKTLRTSNQTIGYSAKNSSRPQF